jgi:hypothetical protein
MNNYIMFEVTLYRNQNSGVMVRCTDSATIFWVLKRIQKVVPTAKLEQPYPEDGKPVSCWFRHLSGNDMHVPWLIVSVLCNIGWEPFYAILAGNLLQPQPQIISTGIS